MTTYRDGNFYPEFFSEKFASMMEMTVQEAFEMCIRDRVPTAFIILGILG